MPASGNTYALGAQVTLGTDKGTLLRDVRAGSGYLSGDPSRLHFGLAATMTPLRLEIRWPDGALSRVGMPAPGMLLTVTRSR